MDIKIRDERVTRTKLTRVRNISRTKLMKEMGRNSRKYRTAIRGLRQAAWDIKNNYKILYENKLEHLRLKFRKTEAEKLDKIPKEMEEYFELSIFDREKFDRLEASSYEVTCVGDVTLSNEEKSVLKLHPKFSIIETLQENTIEFEQELSYAKLRITINKEIQENEELESNDDPSKTPEEEEAALEDEARSRLTFDPQTKVYNDRKRRVTDLEECSRVTLPKPLPTKHETLIEMRRSIHTTIYKDHRRLKCNKKGEQESNLNEEQQQGLKSLLTRIKNKEIVVLKTDKSGKLCVATMEEYVKMGQKHTRKDRIVYRREIQEI